MIKVAIREWHQEHTHNIPGKILKIKNRISALDEKGELSSLTEEEVKDLHGLSFELHSLSRMHSSICWQQSLLNWIREGDANSKFFHGTMSSRRRANNISILDVDGVSVEGVDNVRTAVFNHFRTTSKPLPLYALGLWIFLFVSYLIGRGQISFVLSVWRK
jgi:hypothetical protein